MTDPKKPKKILVISKQPPDFKQTIPDTNKRAYDLAYEIVDEIYKLVPPEELLIGKLYHISMVEDKIRSYAQPALETLKEVSRAIQSDTMGEVDILKLVEATIEKYS